MNVEIQRAPSHSTGGMGGFLTRNKQKSGAKLEVENENKEDRELFVGSGAIKEKHIPLEIHNHLGYRYDEINMEDPIIGHLLTFFDLPSDFDSNPRVFPIIYQPSINLMILIVWSNLRNYSYR